MHTHIVRRLRLIIQIKGWIPKETCLLLLNISYKTVMYAIQTVMISVINEIFIKRNCFSFIGQCKRERKITKNTMLKANDSVTASEKKAG